ncbi:chemokine-like protein TAFA-5 isoform X2 [Electrophorus electricus]|uniref:TAFA chemokine like family member 5 n=1 Tax=Electrophorus electricus TaxID=8005 RepID=A0A4W4H9X0_ELEEL|nr:chemokine-like protein TAFA-5 isoform X2 [Electrophorus electricus]
MQLLRVAWALAGAAVCCFVILLIHSRFLKEGQLAAGTCEIVTLDRDSSQPRRTIARQTARCACRRGQIAGTTRARPACVDARIVKTKQWCDMVPCLEDEGCDLLANRSGWTCTQPGGRVKTTTVSLLDLQQRGAWELEAPGDTVPLSDQLTWRDMGVQNQGLAKHQGFKMISSSWQN